MKTTKRVNCIRTILASLAAGALLCSGQGGLPAFGAVSAISANDFLDSIGTLSAISVRGENLQKTVDCTKYLGVRWLRAGVEGNVPIAQYLELHEQAGVRFSWGLGSGGSNLGKLTETARQLAAAGALLAFEGPNEPNNWAVTYQGQRGGKDHSWMPLATMQSDLYRLVKTDSLLRVYPVWSISEGGAETENVGLQFLTIPQGAGTLMPDGTQYADYANVHNYIYHPNAAGLEDNKTWKAADPTSACKVDGLYGEYGRTWARHYQGYSEAQLLSLPRVTTETGTTIGGVVSEEIHGLNLLTLYLDQFKRGWSYTAVYLLRDRVDEGGNQKFGFYRPDYTPRKAAVYLHNLTAILADRGSRAKLGKLSYSIPAQPATVHDLLLQKTDGAFELVVWDEQLEGSSTIKVDLGQRFSTTAVYDPTIDTSPVQTFSNTNAISLTVSNHPVVIEMPPPPNHR